MDKAEIRRRIEQFRAQEAEHQKYVYAYQGARLALSQLLTNERLAEDGAAPRVLDIDLEGIANDA